MVALSLSTETAEHDPLSAASSGRTVEAVMAAIRRHIRRQELMPGEQVRQNDWAERVGVSRVPVREALNSLALAGVLTHDPHRGFFLTKYTQAELAQLYFVRGVLEVECVRAMRWPTDDEMDQLRKHAALMDDAARDRDAVNWLESHDEFHSLIFSLSPLVVLVEEAERLYIRTESFRSMRAHNALERSHFENMSHTDILDALKSRDRDRLIAHFTKELKVKESDLRQWTSEAK
jgi:DNA-binding GntR family transcriptional regulator